MEADIQLGCELEQWAGGLPRHLALEEGQHPGDVVVPVAGEEGGERQLGKDHQTAAAPRRLAHQRHQPAHHARPLVGEVDGSELGARDVELPCHHLLLALGLTA
jgi:hypothetical protein